MPYNMRFRAKLFVSYFISLIHHNFAGAAKFLSPNKSIFFTAPFSEILENVMILGNSGPKIVISCSKFSHALLKNARVTLYVIFTEL